VPWAASPATASPANVATAIGRKIGSTNASAAAGYSEPLRSTADRNAAPWPGGGVMCVVARKTATTMGSAHSSATLTHNPGAQATVSAVPPRSRRTTTDVVDNGLVDIVDPVRAMPGHLEHDLFQRAPLRADLANVDAAP